MRFETVDISTSVGNVYTPQSTMFLYAFISDPWIAYGRSVMALLPYVGTETEGTADQAVDNLFLYTSVAWDQQFDMDHADTSHLI